MAQARAVASQTRAQIRVLIPAALRSYCAGASELAVAASDIGDALQAVGEQYPTLPQYLFTRAGQLRPFVNVFVRNTDIRALQGLATPVCNHDTVLIVPSVAGG